MAYCDTCVKIHNRDTSAPIQCPTCNEIVGCFWHGGAHRHIRQCRTNQRLYEQAQALYRRARQLRIGRDYDKRIARLCERASRRVLRRQTAFVKFVEQDAR